MTRSRILRPVAPALSAALAVASLAIGVPSCTPTERDFGSGSEGGHGGACEPGTEAPCYEGPEGTEGVGLCHAGTMACKADGSGYEACAGQVLPATDDCQTPDDEDCDGEVPPCSLSYLWGQAPGVLGANNVANGVAAGGDGSVYVAGVMDGTLDFGQGPLTSSGDDDAFVAKLNGSDGGIIWARRFGDAAGQESLGVVADAAGAAIVTMAFAGQLDIGPIQKVSAGGQDVLVAKLSPNGDPLWVVSAGDPQDQQPQAVALTGAGDVIVGGSFSGSLTFGGLPALLAPNNTDVFVVKLDASGVPKWSAQGSGSGSKQLLAAAADADGDVVAVGAFSTGLSFAGNSVTSTGGFDAFVVKLDGQTGAPLWLRSFSGVDQEIASGVAVTATGDILVSGTFDGTTTFGNDVLTSDGEESLFVSRLAPDGKVLATRSFGAGIAGGNRVVLTVDSKDNVVLAGFFTGTLSFGGETFTAQGDGFNMLDAFLAKLDSAGAHVASAAFGSDTLQGFVSVVTDASDHVLVGGATYGPLDIGGGAIGPADITVTTPLVARYSP